MYYIKTTVQATTSQVSTRSKHITRFFYNEQKVGSSTDMFGNTIKQKIYSYDCIECYNGQPTYETLASFLISLKYSDDEEKAILRKKLADIDTNDEFSGYTKYCESCKALAKTLVSSIQ